MIWRRLLVPETMSLHELHGVLQVAMGWDPPLPVQHPEHHAFHTLPARAGWRGRPLV